MLGLGLMLMPAPPRRGPWSAPPCSLDGCRVPWPPSPPPSRAMPTRWASLCRGGDRGGLRVWVLHPPLAPQGMDSQGRGWRGSPGLPWGALLGVGFWVLGLPADAVPLQVHVQLRPHVQHFLESLSKTYEVPGAPQNSPGGSAWNQAGAAAPGWGGLGQLAQEPSSALPRSSSSQRRSRITPRRSWMCWTPKRS